MLAKALISTKLLYFGDFKTILAREMRIALKIAYDGTKFYGFQRQPNVKTVEGEIVSILKKLKVIENCEKANFKGASRTDKGVSAFGNVVAFNTENVKLAQPRVLNHHLKDIWVLGIAEVPEDFHPRFWAIEKVYRYYLVDENFDLGRIKECAKLFIGKHNFSNFAKLEEFKDPVREIKAINVEKRGRIIVLEFVGKSFLWEMVRRLVTALKLCGLGLISLDEIKELLEVESEKKIPPAPPESLVLWEVQYDNISFEIDDYSLQKIRREFFNNFSRTLIRASIFEDWLSFL